MGDGRWTPTRSRRPGANKHVSSAPGTIHGRGRRRRAHRSIRPSAGSARLASRRLARAAPSRPMTALHRWRSPARHSNLTVARCPRPSSPRRPGREPPDRRQGTKINTWPARVAASRPDPGCDSRPGARARARLRALRSARLMNTCPTAYVMNNLNTYTK